MVHRPAGPGGRPVRPARAGRGANRQGEGRGGHSENAEEFVEAFNKGDAKALAAFFTEDGDMIDQDGHQIKGRKAIEEVYTKLFADTKGAKLYIKITSLRVVRPDLALEDGLTEVVPADGGPPSAARYTVVHVKQDGEWRLESVREAIAVPPNNTEHLEDLAFLIGDWTEDVEKGGSSRASYSWDANQNFILNTFDVTMKDVSVASGTQLIGWDAAVKKPRAWSFLFNGGFAEGVWTPDGENKWKIAVIGIIARRRQGDRDERLHEDRRRPFLLPVHRPDEGWQADSGRQADQDEAGQVSRLA